MEIFCSAEMPRHSISAPELPSSKRENAPRPSLVGGEGWRKLSDGKNYQSARGTLGLRLVIFVPWTIWINEYGKLVL